MTQPEPGCGSSSFSMTVPIPMPSAATRVSIRTLLNAPARINQPHLHPKKLNGALWFKIDKSVNEYIRTTWQNNFMGPWWNWTMVPKEKKLDWWHNFVQNYYWDPQHHDLVKTLWKEECRTSIGERISKKKRARSKPEYIGEADWKKMLKAWSSESMVNKSKIASKNRKSDPDGHGMHKHCAGPKSFASIEYNMMLKAGSSKPPPFTDLVRMTHTRKDGSFVDRRAEAIISEVEKSVTDNSSHQLDSAYLRVVKPKRGRIYGLGSTQFRNMVPDNPLHSSAFLSRNLDMNPEIALDKSAEMKQVLETCKLEKEKLTLEVRFWKENYDKEMMLRKETEDVLSRQKQELENALKTIQELTRNKSEKRQPPPSFFCPITQEIMKDPHVAADGFTYEAEEIKKWINTGHEPHR